MMRGGQGKKKYIYMRRNTIKAYISFAFTLPFKGFLKIKVLHEIVHHAHLCNMPLPESRTGAKCHD